jgi:DNA-binding response OmpR family regulator
MNPRIHSVSTMARKSPAESAARPLILVVEDEHDLQELLRFNLSRDGYNVAVAETGEQALQQVRQSAPVLVLLDLMLPGIDGLDVCRAIKADATLVELPIIMVTAKGEDADIVAGLELGADDYITKPFSPRVLMARVRAVLRRRSLEASDKQSDQAASIVRDVLSIYPDRHEASVGGELLDLTATEFRLLVLLARRPGRVFTRQQIIEAVHGGHSAVTDRSVDVQVVSLRRKLGAHADLVQTIRGVGYRFRE